MASTGGPPRRSSNTFNQHRLDVGGTPVHFIHQRGKGPAPIPLILMHGWPWTHYHWHKVIGPLTDPGAYGGDPADAFDIVVPSLPGFGFSTPLTKPRENYASMADRFHALMTEVLGYDKYGVGAADYGALVGARLGHKHADSLFGIHLGNEMPPAMFQGDRFWDLSGGQQTEDLTEATRARLVRRNNIYVSHVAAHLLDGQTLTHSLNDSPVGMLGLGPQAVEDVERPERRFRRQLARRRHPHLRHHLLGQPEGPC